MTRSLSIVEARQGITRLPEELAQHAEEGAVAITRRGQPVLAIMSWEFYESLVETLEIMGDPEALQLFQRSLRDVAAGRTLTLQELEGELSG